jgi:hypothetical protein
VFSLVACFVILGGALAVFEYTGLEERARTPALILLATMILINVVWRAVASLAGRIEQRPRGARVGQGAARRNEWKEEAKNHSRPIKPGFAEP